MIVDLPNTSTRDVAKALVRLRGETGAATLGRVMTLLVVTDDEHADAAVEAAADASRAHPSRIITVVRGNKRGRSRMDAQVRVGGDAGVSESVVLRLYGELAGHDGSVVTPLLVPDCPVVAWWPTACDDDLAATPIGRLARRRISDASQASNPRREIQKRADHYADGDTDMAWSRTTRWRGLLATALDQEPFESVTKATVSGASDSASTDLLAGWLGVRLRCPVRRRTVGGEGLQRVELTRASGPIVLERSGPVHATLSQPGQEPREFPLPRLSTTEALGDELRRLDRDETYRSALLQGLPLLHPQRSR